MRTRTASPCEETECSAAVPARDGSSTLSLAIAARREEKRVTGLTDSDAVSSVGEDEGVPGEAAKPECVPATHTCALRLRTDTDGAAAALPENGGVRGTSATWV